MRTNKSALSPSVLSVSGNKRSSLSLASDIKKVEAKLVSYRDPESVGKYYLN